MKRSDFLAAAGAAGAASIAPRVLAQSSTPQVAGGRTYTIPFASAPYPHASRANGHLYQGKLYDARTHYSDSTAAIFVPDQWHARDGRIDLVVHFYGWNHSASSALEIYHLREQLVQSGRNAILIVPEGPTNAPDSGDGKLELDANGFARFIADICAWLASHRIAPVQQPGRIVLTAHSGGYGGAGGVLTRGGLNANITDVILFDAAYGYFDAFASWQKQSSSNHFLSIFTDDTSTGNAALMAKMQGATPNLFVRLADDMTLANLQTRAPTFVLTTSVEHDQLLQQYSWYSLFLQTTALEVTR